MEKLHWRFSTLSIFVQHFAHISHKMHVKRSLPLSCGFIALLFFLLLVRRSSSVTRQKFSKYMLYMDKRDDAFMNIWTCFKECMTHRIAGGSSSENRHCHAHWKSLSLSWEKEENKHFPLESSIYEQKKSKRVRVITEYAATSSRMQNESRNAVQVSDRQFGELFGLVTLAVIVNIMVNHNHISRQNANSNIKQISNLLKWKRTLKKKRTSISLNDFKKSTDLINSVWRDKCWYSARIDIGDHSISNEDSEWLDNCKTDLGTGLQYTRRAYEVLWSRRIKQADRNNLMWVLCILEDGFGKGSDWFNRALLSGASASCPWG